MFALMLQNHLPFILSFAASLFIALGLGIVLGDVRTADPRALGDPNAPRPTDAVATPILRDPVARPSAPIPAAPPPGGGAAENLIDARAPDVRFHPAAIAAARCAIGRDVVHDPDLDAVAAAI